MPPTQLPTVQGPGLKYVLPLVNLRKWTIVGNAFA